MIDLTKCPIWNAFPAQVAGIPSHNGYGVSSPRTGGEYRISGHAVVNIKTADVATRRKLTNWLIDQRIAGNLVPEITADLLQGIEGSNERNIRERIDNFLFYSNKYSNFLGERITFNSSDDYTVRNSELLAWTSSITISEVCRLAAFCNNAELISLTPGYVYEYEITPQGLERLENLRFAKKSSTQAFVAMWFDPSMDETYKNAIAPAVMLAGYQPMRIDGKDHNNKIDDEIIAEIRRSRFVVADFTQGESARGGVYYEAGLAHGLNLPVIFTCKKDCIEKVHFDTRQYNHIVWETHDYLKTALSQRISATIGDGPLRTPSR